MSFVEAAKLADVPDGGSLGIEVGDLDVALVRFGEEVYAILDWCSHGEVPLSDGEVDADDRTVECYLHGSTFDLRTGQPMCLPATEPVPIYATKIEGDTVWVDLPDESEN